jgi:hypothetical protein
VTTLELFILALIRDSVCPQCLGDLDTWFECSKCKYDGWVLLIEANQQEIYFEEE